jgi:hypothetical protein
MTRKKRNKYWIKEKQLIALKMKDREIHEAIGNQGWIELDKPQHDGYFAEWVLRDDIKRREDAQFFQEALDACKERIWSRTPEFRIKNRKTKKWEHVNPKLIDINKEKYESLSASAKKFFFESTDKIHRRRWRIGFSDKWYSCTLSYELVVHVSKSFITHRREHNNILYQMDAENEKMMYQIAGSNNNPWGWSDSSYRWSLRHENKKEKLKAERKLVETVKAYKGITKKRDLLDL